MRERGHPTSEDADTVELSLFSGVEFFKHLSSDISRTSAGDRVAILTMSFEPDEPLVAEVINQLLLAADRGTNIAFGVDAYTFLIDDSSKSIGPLLLPIPIRQAAFKRRRRAIDQLAGKDSIACSIVNKPGRMLTNPYAGRSHIKIAIVNNKVKIGGPNFHKSDRPDISVEFEDSETADKLYELTKQIIEEGNTAEVLGEHDQIWPIDSKTKIMIDSGVRNQSLILDTALQIIEDAQKKVVGSFQFFPNGVVADSLIRTHKRGVNVSFTHNHPIERGLLLGSVEYLTRVSQKRRMPKSFFSGQAPRGTTVHGSAIASEHSAIVGGHNLVERGVKFGTPELVVCRREPSFAHRVGEFIFSQVEPTQV